MSRGALNLHRHHHRVPHARTRQLFHLARLHARNTRVSAQHILSSTTTLISDLGCGEQPCAALFGKQLQDVVDGLLEAQVQQRIRLIHDQDLTILCGRAISAVQDVMHTSWRAHNDGAALLTPREVCVNVGTTNQQHRRQRFGVACEERGYLVDLPRQFAGEQRATRLLGVRHHLTRVHVFARTVWVTRSRNQRHRAERARYPAEASL